ncbi:MAG: hypothetical protein RL702_410 [Pseudomonadota bacterium]
MRTRCETPPRRGARIALMIALSSVPALSGATASAQDNFDTGLGAAPIVSDSELAEMRGKFISADSVRFFGVTLHSLWQTEDGIATAATLGFSVWLGEDGASGPQVVVQWQRDGDPDMDVSGFSGDATGNYVITGAAGAVQTNVIAGSDNVTANRMGMAVVPASSLSPATGDSNFGGTATHTASDGDTVTFTAANGQFGLSMVDAQGAGTVKQGVTTDPAQLSQSILLNSDHNTVTNTMNVTVGIDRGQMLDSVNVANSLSVMKGHGF